MNDAISPKTIRFIARDGWELEGDIFAGKDPKVAILISAGTGFPRGFYRAAAACLAERGGAVLTFDYRGMGGSKSSHEAFLGIDYPDWGRLDMPAAVDALAAQAPGLPITDQP